MPCFYCGKRVSIVRQLTDADFCSEDHRKKYHELTRMALNRLVETHEQMVTASPRGKAREEPLTAATLFPEPVAEVKATPVAPSRPASPPRPAPHVVITAPPPPPPPPMRVPSAVGFSLGPLAAHTMEDGLWLALGVEFRTTVFEFGRFAAPALKFSLPAGGPVLSRLDPNTLRQAGRARLVSASYRGGFGSPSLQRDYSRRLSPYSGLAGPGGGGFVPYSMFAGLAGPLRTRTPVAESVKSEERVVLARLVHQAVAAVFPSGGLKTNYGRPAFRALRSALRAESSPRFSAGFCLPELPVEATPPCGMPASALWPTGTPARVNIQIAARSIIRPTAFAQPDIWLPESNFIPEYTDPTAAIESMLPGWILEVPRFAGSLRVPRVEPTPRRSPRPAIPVSPGWPAAEQLTPATLIPALSAVPAGPRRIILAMTLRAAPVAFSFPLALPASTSEGGVSGVPIEAGSALATSGLAALAPFGQPSALDRAREAKSDARRGAPLFAAATPVLPEVSTLGGATRSVPGQAAYLGFGLPAPVKGRASRPAAAGQVSLPGASIAPVLPVVSEVSVPQWLLTLAPMAPGSLPGVVRPPGGVRAGGRDSEQFPIAPLLPEAPQLTRRFEQPGESASAPAPAFVRSLEPSGLIDAAAVPKAVAGRRERAVAPAQDFTIRPNGIESPYKPEVHLSAGEYAPSGALRVAPAKSAVRIAGPALGALAVSLPFDGPLASTALLASVEGFVRQPGPVAGILRRGLGDLAPLVPPQTDPQIAAVALALAGRAGTPTSDLQATGTLRAHTRPAAPRALPGMEIPAPDLSMLELAAPARLHSLPHPASIPVGMKPAVRGRRPAPGLRQDLQAAEPHLPELDTPDTAHMLAAAPELPQSITAASVKPHPPVPAGFTTGEFAVAFPARMAYSGTVRLGGGQAAVLPVRPNAWILATHSTGWAAFPPDQAQMPDLQGAAADAIVLLVGGIEALPSPRPKVPLAGSPLLSETPFPPAEPSRPQTEVAAEPRELPTLPPAVLVPAVLRGTPQKPWTATVEMAARPAWLPGFGTGIRARLGLAGQDLQEPAPVRARDAVAFLKARRVAVPIRPSDEIHAPDARLSPDRRLVVASADILRAAQFPDARKVASRTQPARAAEFPLAPPMHAQSQVAAACRTLIQGAPWSVAGRTQPGAFIISSREAIGLLPPPAEVPGPRSLNRALSLTDAGWKRVPPPARAGAAVRQTVGWQAVERDRTSTNFRSIESRVSSLEWPTQSSGQVLAEGKPAAMGKGFRIAPFSGEEFPCPAALWPESAGFTQALGHAPLHSFDVPGRMEAPQTARTKVRLEPVFRPVRRPGRLPVFHALYRRAAMPSGYFTYFEAHEDFEDFSTMGMAPRYEASSLEPLIPATASPLSAGGDFDYPHWLPPFVPSPDCQPRPIGTWEFPVPTPMPRLPGEVEEIPEVFDAGGAELAKGPGIVGAIKNASRFFKFMTLGVPGLLIFSVALWNALGGSMVQTLESRAAVRFEESFRSEPTSWLGQIDRQSMAWVYRAADLRNFYAARIAFVKRGPLPSAVLESYAVVDGRETGRVRVPIPVVLRDGKPYRVQLNVFGNGFTTPMDGKIVDFWSDDRPRAGGAGFFSNSREDRAHPYWMRVAYQDDFWGKMCARIAPG